MSAEQSTSISTNQPKFIHLRVHSDYSMVDGVTKIKP
ncbi:MAG: DNA polymerase-3 subunit alpha, partial [Psychromonas sp.]